MGLKVNENEKKKEAGTFILNIPRSYSSNLRLEISKLLRDLLAVIRISVSPSFNSAFLRKDVGQGGDIWLLFHVNIKSTGFCSQNFLLYFLCRMKKEVRARFGTSCKYLKTLIINIEGKKSKGILLDCLYLGGGEPPNQTILMYVFNVKKNEKVQT